MTAKTTADKTGKIATAFRIKAELLQSLDVWCATQRPPTNRTAVIEMLIEEFLAKGGPAQGSKT